MLNVFRMFAKMNGKRVPVTSSAELPLQRILSSGVREQPDVAAIASREDRRVSVLIWHYHDDDVAGPDAAVTLTVAGVGRKVKQTHYRIDERHSNSYAEWKRLGSPLAPDQTVYAQLEKAGQLTQLSPSE